MTNLHALVPIGRAICRLMPGQIEVVLHDLESGQIAHIENAFSPRKPGDDSLTETSDYQSELQADDTIGPYLKANPDGSRLRSVSALLRDDMGNPRWLLCFNLRISELEVARDALIRLTALTTEEPSEFIKHDWREVANAILAATLNELKMPVSQLRRPQRLTVASRLQDAGVFSAKGSKDYVAEALGISRAGLYDLLKEVKQPPAERF